MIFDSLNIIIGKGEGSTPSSDDLFCGFITSLMAKNRIGTNLRILLSKFPYERRTTKKSAKLIRSILNYNLPEELNRFFHLLSQKIADENSIHQFRREILYIRSIGFSSGYYFLKGVQWGLEMIGE